MEKDEMLIRLLELSNRIPNTGRYEITKRDIIETANKYGNIYEFTNNNYLHMEKIWKAVYSARLSGKLIISNANNLNHITYIGQEELMHTYHIPVDKDVIMHLIRYIGDRNIDQYIASVIILQLKEKMEQIFEGVYKELNDNILYYIIRRTNNVNIANKCFNILVSKRSKLLNYLFKYEFTSISFNEFRHKFLKKNCYDYIFARNFNELSFDDYNLEESFFPYIRKIINENSKNKKRG